MAEVTANFSRARSAGAREAETPSSSRMGWGVYPICRRVGVNNAHSIIIIGVGNLGHALMQNFPFADIGFSLDAAFDVSPAMIGTKVNGVDVRSLDELDGYCADHLPDVAILTVPRSAAQSTVDRLVGLGIRGFWNFTNKEVTSDRPDIQVESVHFADSLLTLSYRITKR